MANFRSGYLQRGGPLGKKTLTVSLQESSTDIDPRGYTAIKLMGEEPHLDQDATSTGTTLVVVTVTTVDHGLSTSEVIRVYDAAGWTTPEDVNKFDATVTVVDDDTFTYQYTPESGESPGASGTVSWKLQAEDRPFTIQPSTLPGHQILIYLGNDGQAQLSSSTGVHLNSDWDAVDQYDSLTLVYQDSTWVEVSRGLLGSDFDERIFNPQSGQIVIYNDGSGYFENRTMSSDATISSNGRLFLSENIRRRTITQLSASEITDLHNTTQLVLPPQGSGSRVVVDEIQIYFYYDGTQFAGLAGDSNFTIQYDTGNNIVQIDGDMIIGLIQDDVRIAKPSYYNVAGGSVQSAIEMMFADNQGLRLTNTGAAFTAGSGTIAMEFHVIYHIMET